MDNLKLKSYLSTTNMVLFHPNGSIKKFGDEGGKGRLRRRQRSQGADAQSASGDPRLHFRSRPRSGGVHRDEPRRPGARTLRLPDGAALRRRRSRRLVAVVANEEEPPGLPGPGACEAE